MASTNDLETLRNLVVGFTAKMANPKTPWDDLLRTEMVALTYDLKSVEANGNTTDLKMAQFRFERIAERWEIFNDATDPLVRQVGMGMLLGEVWDTAAPNSLILKKSAQGIDSGKIFLELQQNLKLVEEILVRSYSLQWEMEQALHAQLNETPPGRKSLAFRNKPFDCKKGFADLHPMLKQQMEGQCQYHQETFGKVGLPVTFDQLASILNEKVKVFDNLKEKYVDSRRGWFSKYKESFPNAENNFPLQRAKLLANEDYMGIVQQVRSCQSSLFETSGALKPLLTRALPKIYDDYRKENLYPKLPWSKNHPIGGGHRHSQERREKRAMTHLAVKLGREKQKLLELSHKFRQIINERFKKFINLKEQISHITSYNQLIYLSERTNKYLAEIIEISPLVTGMTLLNHRINTSLFRATLYEANALAKQRKNRMDSILLWTLAIGITALIFPGSTIVIASLSARLGHVIYAGVLATQTFTAAEYIQINQQKLTSVQAQSIVYPMAQDYWGDMTAEEVEKAIFDGGLTIALLAVGETLGLAKVGNETVAKYASQFLSWARYHLAKQMINPLIEGVTKVTTRLTEDMTHNMKIYEGVKGGKMTPSEALPQLRSSTPAETGLHFIPKSEEAFSRATELIIAVQGSREVQKHLNIIVNKVKQEAGRLPLGFHKPRRFPLEKLEAYEARLAKYNATKSAFYKAKREADKKAKYFLDVFIERLFMEAHQASAMGVVTKRIFERRAVAIIDELYEVSKFTDDFLQKLRYEITVAAPFRGNKEIVAQLEDLRRQLPNFGLGFSLRIFELRLTGKLLGAFSKEVATKSQEAVEFLLKYAAQVADTRKAIYQALKEERSGETLARARNAMSPYAAQYADASKEASLTALQEARSNALYLFSRDQRFVNLFLTGGPLPRGQGYSVHQAGYWFQNATRIVDLIEDHLGRVGGQGGLAFKELREGILNFLSQLKDAPANQAWTYLNLSEDVAHGIHIMRGAGRTQQQINDFLLKNSMDCSINLNKTTPSP